MAFREITEKICSAFKIFSLRAKYVLDDIIGFTLQNKPCFIFQKTWMNSLFCSRTTIWRAIKELKNIINTDRSNTWHCNNVYTLTEEIKDSFAEYFSTPNAKPLEKPYNVLHTTSYNFDEQKQASISTSFEEFHINGLLKPLIKKKLMMESEAATTDEFLKKVFYISKTESMFTMSQIKKTITKTIIDLEVHKKTIYDKAGWFKANFITHLKRSFIRDEDKKLKLDALLKDDDS